MLEVDNHSKFVEHHTEIEGRNTQGGGVGKITRGEKNLGIQNTRIRIIPISLTGQL